MGIKPVIPSDHFEADPPPPYDAFDTSTSLPHDAPNINTTGSCSKSLVSPLPSTSHQLEPVQFCSPDPRRVYCRCGTRVDTTVLDDHLPLGSVYCDCGYIVSSTGQAHYPDLPSACSCGARLPKKVEPRALHHCKCGLRYYGGGVIAGSQRQLSRPTTRLNERRVRCSCGKIVDTSARCVVAHGGKATASNGQSVYTYELPRGAARCACGITVHSNGTRTKEHSNKCCKISRVEKGDAEKKGEKRRGWRPWKVASGS